MKNNALLSIVLAFGLIAPVLAQTSVPAPAPAVDQLTRGLLMRHDGRMIFAPCRERLYATVEDVSPSMVVTAALAELGLEAGKNLYVEFFGQLDGSTLRASAINFARQEARCQLGGGGDELWRAAGNDPAWSLVAGSGHWSLRQDGKPEVKLTYRELQNEGVSVQILGASEGAEGRFERRLCHDKTAGILFGWQAEVKVGGVRLQGCAWQR